MCFKHVINGHYTWKYFLKGPKLEIFVSRVFTQIFFFFFFYYTACHRTSPMVRGWRKNIFKDYNFLYNIFTRWRENWHIKTNQSRHYSWKNVDAVEGKHGEVPLTCRGCHVRGRGRRRRSGLPWSRAGRGSRIRIRIRGSRPGKSRAGWAGGWMFWSSTQIRPVWVGDLGIGQKNQYFDGLDLKIDIFKTKQNYILRLSFKHCRRQRLKSFSAVADSAYNFFTAVADSD